MWAHPLGIPLPCPKHSVALGLIYSWVFFLQLWSYTHAMQFTIFTKVDHSGGNEHMPALHRCHVCLVPEHMHHPKRRPVPIGRCFPPSVQPQQPLISLRLVFVHIYYERNVTLCGLVSRASCTTFVFLSHRL